jgi:hypothetical protein
MEALAHSRPFLPPPPIGHHHQVARRGIALVLHMDCCDKCERIASTSDFLSWCKMITRSGHVDGKTGETMVIKGHSYKSCMVTTENHLRPLRSGPPTLLQDKRIYTDSAKAAFPLPPLTSKYFTYHWRVWLQMWL